MKDENLDPSNFTSIQHLDHLNLINISEKLTKFMSFKHI